MRPGVPLSTLAVATDASRLARLKRGALFGKSKRPSQAEGHFPFKTDHVNLSPISKPGPTFNRAYTLPYNSPLVKSPLVTSVTVDPLCCS